MYKTIAIIVLSILSLAFVGAVTSSSKDHASEDDDSSERYDKSASHEIEGEWFSSRVDVPPARNETYRSECGSCHFAYQPGLLPESAWNLIMDALEDHFGDDATLEPATAIQLRNYLATHAADYAKESRSRAFSVGVNNASVLPRITGTQYFLNEHHEIPERFSRDNPAVGSFSNCQGCHRKADAGVYNEHQVVIPGYGRWED